MKTTILVLSIIAGALGVLNSLAPFLFMAISPKVGEGRLFLLLFVGILGFFLSAMALVGGLLVKTTK